MSGTRREVRDLGGGVSQFQSPLWQTNSVVALADGDAVVCDPALMPAEIEEIRAAVERSSARAVRLLITHADFDHACGIPYFPGAEVIAAAESAARIDSGAVGDELRAAGEEWGVEWPTGGLRVDRAVGEGELSAGSCRLEAIAAPDHGRDEGVAYMLFESEVLLPGDHLSSITYPLLAGPIERMVRATERLLDALGRHAVRWVVPGHGPALTADEARVVGEADLDYLRRLERAADEAVSDDLAPGYALLHVYAIEPPRATTPDFEIYNVRAGNARQALAAARERVGARR